MFDPDNRNWINGTSGNPDGSYEINGIWPGQYIIRVESPGYVTKFYDGTDNWDSATSLIINANDNIEDFDFAMERGFSIVASVKNKHLPDGSFRTGLEAVIDNNFYGTLPDDIESITVTAPSGQLPINKDDFEYLDQWLDFAYDYNGSPEIGIYTFEMASGGYTATATDTQDVLRTLPLIDENALSPADGTLLDSA